DGDRARVRGEDRALRCDPIELGPQPTLDVEVLEDRLDDQVGVGGRAEVGRRPDECDRRVARARIETTLGHGALEVSGDPVATCGRARHVALLASAALAVGAAAAVAPAAAAGETQTYLVLFKAQAVPADAATVAEAAGGEFVASYGQIGVAVARSASGAFKSTLLGDSRIAA